MASTSRFHVATEDEISENIKNRIPTNTQSKIRWAMKLFKSWHQEWKVRLDESLKVYKDIDEFNKSDLNHCLIYFFAEARRADGKMYPPETLKAITCMIQLYYRTEHKWEFSIFNDAEFLKCRESLHAFMKKSAGEGNQKPKKRALPINYSQEDTLWENGTFGRSNPKQLVKTLIYHLGLHLSLRAASEHRNLEYGTKSQLSLKDKDGIQYIEYVERVSKNKRFGLSCTNMEPKITCIYPNTNNKSRCIVQLYKDYISRRPTNLTTNAFYLVPLPESQIKSNVWYKNCPLGIHSIENTTKELMKSIDDGKFYSNTSLRRSAKTRLTEAGIPREISSFKTGRVSEKADQVYIHRENFEQQMSKALYQSSYKEANIFSNEKSEKYVLSNCSFHNCHFN